MKDAIPEEQRCQLDSRCAKHNHHHGACLVDRDSANFRWYAMDLLQVRPKHRATRGVQRLLNEKTKVKEEEDQGDGPINNDDDDGDINREAAEQDEQNNEDSYFDDDSSDDDEESVDE